ncbi:MAG TPA: hypothetical protein VMG08_14745 [Allosphingosinicella sp.]|nr:hypothetical protein [Allosphingosinicella sp.]
MSTIDFYQARAAEAREAAVATTLANVCTRHLRAAAAWDGMAERAARTARHREEEATRRAMRRDRETAILQASRYPGQVY